MTRSDIIELAHQLTERKAEKILDMNLLFSSTCQDICKRGRHWWRKGDVTFNMTQGVTTYDLTSIVTSPALTNQAVDEIMGITLVLQTSPLNTADLTPIFDRAGILAMKNNTQQAQPSRYTMKPGDWKTILIDPPDATYLAELSCWLMPNLSKETSDDTVPLIPPFYHNIIVEGLEMRINKRVYGANDTRYRDSLETYNASILSMMMRPQFTSNYSRQWVTDETYVDGTGGTSIQSTAPNSTGSP